MIRKYNVNDDFFKNIDSEIKAYLLGFFLADGTYGLGARCTKSYRFQVTLQEEDLEIISLFKEFIVPTKEIAYKVPKIDKNGINHKGVYTITWTSNKMNFDL